MADSPADIEKARSSLVELAVESWRFSRLFLKVVGKLDAGEANRYINQSNYFQKNISKSLEENDLNLVDVEGHEYEAGLAVTPLNSEEFEDDDVLVVDHMVEPIIMDSEGVRKIGTVMLKKRAKQ